MSLAMYGELHVSSAVARATPTTRRGVTAATTRIGRIIRTVFMSSLRPPRPAGCRSGCSHGHLERVQPADEAVDGVDDAPLVDEHVVDLDGAHPRAGGRRRDVVGDLPGAKRVRYVVGAHAPVEEGADDDGLGRPRA